MGGTVTLYVWTAGVWTGRVEVSVLMIFSGDEMYGVDSDTASPVSPDYTREASVGQVVTKGGVLESRGRRGQRRLRARTRGVL